MENKSNVEQRDMSFLPFTEEELKELNLTPEELDILEYAGAYAQTVELLPDDFDAFTEKIGETFSDVNTPDGAIEKITDLCESDPEFVSQMIAFQEVISAVKPYQEEEDYGTGK